MNMEERQNYQKKKKDTILTKAAEKEAASKEKKNPMKFQSKKNGNIVRRENQKN